MTTLIGFLQQPLVHGMAAALGWTLLHFCWQGAVVAAGLWCVLGLIGQRWSQARYVAACIALGLMVALPVGTFVRLAKAEIATERAMAVRAVVLDFTIDAVTPVGPVHVPFKTWVKQTLDRSAPWVPAVWLTGVILFVVRLNVGLVVARRLQTAGTELVPAELQETFERLREDLGLQRAVQLMHSAMVQVPTVIGWLRPVVLIPASCLSGLSTMQVEAILCHELAHVRRHDYLVSVFQSVVEALLFYHPAVWWVSKQVRRERECCCDELAVANGGDVLAYARALSMLEERRASFPEFVLGANGGALSMRIRRLLGYGKSPMISMPAAIALSAVVLAAAGVYLGGVARAQAKLRLKLSEPIALVDTPAPTSVVTSSTKSREHVYLAKADLGELPHPGTVQGDDQTRALRSPYKEWVQQDVRWIITPEEQAAFVRLTNDEQRDNFIKKFWVERDPAGAAPDTFKTEHYKRIAYTNEHFASNKPGWMTDRGHTYIAYGKPEDVESYPTATPYPYEVWHYRSMQGISDGSVTMTFIEGPGGASEVRRSIEGAPVQGASKQIDGASSTETIAKLMVPSQVNAAQIQEEGAIQGIVIDPTGALVPRAKVTATNSATGTQAAFTTDNTGKFSFSALPSGTYRVEAEARGFQNAVQQNVAVEYAQHATMNLKLRIGTAAESLTVTGNSVANPNSGQVSTPLRVNGDLLAKVAISKSAPIYPPIAKAAGEQGTVVLAATITKTGTVKSLAVVSGPPMLTTSAMDAVRQWVYPPYLLNGQPREVATTISVNFTLPADVRAAQGQLAAVASTNRPQRVSAGVIAGLLISKVNPIYPQEAKAAHIEGIVVLHALISKAGEVENLQVVSGPKELLTSAIDAVRQWTYKPYLLNGEPTAVETTVTINYTLGDDSNPPVARNDFEGSKAPMKAPASAMEGNLTYKVAPVYPAIAKAGGIQGAVVLHAIISKTGTVERLTVVSGPRELSTSALDAVRQWKYKPYLLNGEPTEVETTVTVNFSLGDDGVPNGSSNAVPDRIRSITYAGLNAIPLSEVGDRMGAENVGLKLEAPYDPSVVRHAAAVLNAMLVERGYTNAVIAPTIGQMKPSGVSVVFEVREGQRALALTISSGASDKAGAGNGPVKKIDRKNLAVNGMGGGPRIKDGVTAPVLIRSVEPEFTEEARKAKKSGAVLVNFIVNQKGMPSRVHVLKGVDQGLDKRAVDAVRQYRFQPAMKGDRPVDKEMNVEVNFQIF